MPEMLQSRRPLSYNYEYKQSFAKPPPPQKWALNPKIGISWWQRLEEKYQNMHIFHIKVYNLKLIIEKYAFSSENASRILQA